MDEAFESYLTGLVALRKRVVDDMRRKLNDGTVLDDPRQGARSRSEDSMLAATILVAQLRCAPNASGNVNCYDKQKGGSPVLKVEPNLRRFRPPPERREGRAVREEGKRGDGVSYRSGDS